MKSRVEETKQVDHNEIESSQAYAYCYTVPCRLPFVKHRGMLRGGSSAEKVMTESITVCNEKCINCEINTQ